MADDGALVLRPRSFVRETYIMRRTVWTFVIVISAPGALVATFATGMLWLLAVVALLLAMSIALYQGFEQPIWKILEKDVVPWCFPTSTDDVDERQKRLTGPRRFWWPF